MTRSFVILAALLLINLSLTENAEESGHGSHRRPGVRKEHERERQHGGRIAEFIRKHGTNGQNMSSVSRKKPAARLDHSPVRSKRPNISNGDRMTKSGSRNTLQLVNLMFRHGDRAPEPLEIASFPNYENKNETWAPVGAGHLTNRGKLRLYKLGKTIRSRYGKFLGDEYNFDIMNTFSTDVPRARASALMFHAGLWPPIESQQWSDDENLAAIWQPIIYTSDPKLSNTMNAFLNSPCYHQAYNRVLREPELQQVLFSQEKLFNYLTEQTGTKVATPMKVWILQSLYKAQEAMGKPKPDWVAEVWDELTAMTNLTFATMFSTDELKRMATGPVLKKIIEDCQDKADGVLEPRGRKMFVYSGHDMTVAPLFAALGGDEGFLDEEDTPIKSIVPSFGSCVVLELHKLENKEHAVKVLYNEGSEDGSLKPLRFANGEEMYPLDKFVEMTTNVASYDQKLDVCSNTKNARSLVQALMS